jgi:hypothetical protein
MVKRQTTAICDADAGLERIKLLEEQLAPTSLGSRQRKTLKAALRIEVDAYRKTLDAAQAAAMHDARPRALVALGSLKRPSVSSSPRATIVPPRKTRRRARSAPRR